jgi:hypothetical protein
MLACHAIIWMRAEALEHNSFIILYNIEFITNNQFQKNCWSFEPFEVVFYQIFLWQVFDILQLFTKRIFCYKFPVSCKKSPKKFQKFVKYYHNCLQYESVLKIFYFHILNITKAKYTYGQLSLEQHHKIEKKNIALKNWQFRGRIGGFEDNWRISQPIIIHSKVKFWPIFFYCYFNSIACMLGSTLYALWKVKIIEQVVSTCVTGKLGQYFP